MFNKELISTLWEDDAKGQGHNGSNKPIDAQKAKVDKNGVAVVEFMLTKALMQKALQGETDPKKLEFYVTVEYYKNKKHTSGNVDVNNSFPQTPKPHPKTPTTPTKPAKPATIPKAKGSPAEQKPPSKKEEKGIGERIIETGKELWDWWESKGTATKEKTPTAQTPDGKSSAIVKGEAVRPSVSNCGEKYCIKKGDKSELIREINIRLSGFGGNIPTDEFTDRTEKMIKQFQKDYMKVPETGKVCGNVLKAIDDFQNKYIINFDDVKCPCGEM
ncbi:MULTISPECIES: peptidoglycan-binding domain-containing protein [unclassified Chryseobacterium]|uniref:peptidoglycan-binding domain-containing protein n=1 Tax=unclassified Chryseobacterium TaxID=2593645 RepID=UPI003017857A